LLIVFGSLLCDQLPPEQDERERFRVGGTVFGRGLIAGALIDPG
jgi:hypothetical protein